MAGKNRGTSRTQSGKMAFSGLMAALSVALMLTGGLIPIATYCAPMICGILLLPLILEFGRKTAWTAYAAVALITLVLGIDKEAAFFYLFLGFYPIVKWDVDKIKSKPLRLVTKLVIFNAAVALMYTVLGFVLNMTVLVEEFTEMGSLLLIAFVVLFNLCMLLYDKLLTPMAILYLKKLRPKLRFLRR